MSQGPGTGDPGPGGITRRELLGALGAAALPVLGGAGVGRGDGHTGGRAGGLQTEGPAGTPSDPDLLHPKVWWEKVLTAGELTTLTALADAIIPADERSPSASQVGVPDYINEWASAPYDSHREALGQIRDGLVWLDVEAQRRFSRRFDQLVEAEQQQICDEICYLPKAKPELQAAAKFFDLIRDLCATGFYTTREGMKDLQYVGNVPLQRFDGPPPEVLRHLGLA